ncbi:GlsB/YeaQ/YmgE family stress response membrane protein [uncultured Pseudodesulfovibrio sp.]|uniref:GlsB/YeaQ/YmgE family stress response membrane protein n=1 Tax=uncultured Pseudodesulfovibrio sp. TaxID=2035858 RepID=UPI0029C6741B|nr:GlsB/YeaQ/YmgE family stress response membrane protein [uncultured Pseudodesulfovibrio sp.]
MGIIAFLLIGLVAGFLAGKILKGGGFGLVGNMIVGLVGAIVGGFVFRFVGVQTTSMIGELVTATVGALLFLFVLGLIKK